MATKKKVDPALSKAGRELQDHKAEEKKASANAKVLEEAEKQVGPRTPIEKFEERDAVLSGEAVKEQTIEKEEKVDEEPTAKIKKTTETITCGSCGASNPKFAMVCKKCGYERLQTDRLVGY